MGFEFYSSYVALWIWAIFQGLLTLATFRQVLELEKRSRNWKGMPGGESLVGARAPEFSGDDLRSGRPINVNIFEGQGGVILFLAAYCSACRRLAKSLQGVSLGSLPPIVASCTGDEKETLKLGKRLGPQIPLLLDGAGDTAYLYRVSSYPTAVILDGECRIRAHSGISSAEDVQQLLARSAAGDTKDGELAIASVSSRQNI